jgi:hypothetical protein
MHLSRSLCTNVDGEAWRATGTGLRRGMCWQSSVMRCAGSTGSAVGVSSSRVFLGARRTRAQLPMLAGPL